jgi:hypothetical protein
MGTHDVPVTYVDAAAVLGTFDMRGFAMETPVPNLVAEATVPPCWAIFIGMFGVIGPALTAIVPHELHDGPASGWCLPFLLQHGAHRCLVKGRPL